jgi:glucose/arabinose dehydrogenase
VTHATRARSRRSVRSVRAALTAATLALTLSGPASAAPSADAATPALAATAALMADGASTSLAPAAFDPTAFTLSLTTLRKGFTQPIFATNAGDGTNRVYVVEKVGRIKVLSAAGGYLSTLLDISSRVSRGGEQGLLGLAFHPDYASNHKYYVDYTDRSGDTIIVEYRSSANGLSTVGGRVLLTIAQPYSNHNGGMLAFGQDGLLYIGMGDGGSAGDPGNRAQNVDSPLGKILRINVNGSSGGHRYAIPSTNPYVGRPGLDIVWSRGLRNPWRFSFDRANGDIWIGDVGQDRYEEVDHYANSSSGPGRGANYGWRQLEGRHCYNPRTGCSTAGKVMPLVEYSHAGRDCSVIGGYVYRGSAYPAMVGGYFFSDLCSHRIRVVAADATAPATAQVKMTIAGTPVSFGESEDGELFLVTLGGGVYKLGAA